MNVTPALRRKNQEDHEFQASLGSRAILRQKERKKERKNKKKSLPDILEEKKRVCKMNAWGMCGMWGSESGEGMGRAGSL
jgi:hypothetical protein